MKGNMKYNKLVRDNIPEIIAATGKEAVTHLATAKEYETKLLEKLSEEIVEIQADPNPEELADLLEVIHAICELKSYDLNEIEAIRQKKSSERGGFSKKIILDEVKE
jgi:predicted house-cleaning noncanonical NTP pyrophosphatase (MazG superfamily)